jgi:low temperature requirement protein LtrA
MNFLSARVSYLRARHGHSRVTFVELFFDLVFVFAVTQLSHGLLEHLTPLGALQTAVLMLAVWWAWIDNAWVTNWLDPERAPVRLMLFTLMLLGLVISAAIPKAFEERAAAFALAYGTMEIVPKLFMLWALRRHDAGNFRNFVRITIWRGAGAACWIAGGFASSEARLAVWGLALAIDTGAPIVGFRVPGLGHSTTADWTVEAGHLAERCGLFVIIALGESILITGATFAGLAWTPTTFAAFANCFIGSVAMWVVYFNIGAERSSRVFSGSADPGRLARSGYTYMHIPIVAGIIVAAVADELTLAHPGGHTSVAAAAVILGGPALYLAGNLLFKGLTAPYRPLSHYIGLGLLALAILAVPYATPLALSAATTAVLILVAVWEWASLVLRAGKPPLGHA